MRNKILLGANAGIDARNRSNIGVGNESFRGCDENESTLFSTLPIVFYISGKHIVIDGFTIIYNVDYCERGARRGMFV